MTLLLPPQVADAEGYDITVVPDIAGDRQVYLASHPELPGLMAQGETPYDAVLQLAEARDVYLASMARRGLSVPAPHRNPRLLHVDIPTASADENLIVHWGS